MKKVRSSVSFLLTVLIVLFSMAPAASAVQNYPEGVTKQQLQEIIPKLDTAINSLLESTGNKSLGELVLPEIYSDKTLSALTVGFYSMIEENAESISSAGIKVTTADVAECLGNYPDVQKKLSSYGKWSEVNLDGAIWSVKGKETFIKALGCIFVPFNELLYTLLCDGNYPLNKVIGIDGDFGYENAIIPTLKALGCEKITESAEFYKDAEKNKNSMVENIVSDVFTLLEKALEAPCDKLTDILPSVAYFLNNGGFDNAVATLIEPLRLQIFNLKTFIKIETILSFIQNSEEYTQSFTLNLNDILSGTGLKMAEINLDELASCGTVSGDSFVSDKADAFLIILRWLVDTLKLNKDSLSGGEIPAEMTQAVNSMMSKSTDEIIKGIVSILTQSSSKPLEYSWTFPEHTPAAVTYTQNLGADKYQRVVEGIDDLINEFILEGGKYKNTNEALKPQIYSNAVVTELAKTVYSVFEADEMKTVCDLLGLNVSTYGVANILKGSSYSSARYTLYRTAKWSNIGSINWGFKDGNKDGFVNALCDVLSPFEPMLNLLLAEGKITLFRSIDIYGSSGYNTAIIPILEALGCSADSIKTYEEYKISVSKNEGIKAIAEPITALIDRIIEKPVYTVTEILPNVLWFIESGGMNTALNNLLYPVTSLLKELGMENTVDMSSLTEELDINEMLTGMLGSTDMGIDVESLDIKQFASMGQVTTVSSKRTLNGQPTTVSYIKADQPAIIVTLLRFIAEFMKTPGNDDMMLSMMGDTEDSMMSQFSGGLGEELQNMTVDETVEWLYKLFFRERAVVEEKVTEKYLPTVIYEKEEKTTSAPFAVVVLVAAIAIAVVIIKKKKSHLDEDEDDFETEDEKDFQEV